MSKQKSPSLQPGLKKSLHLFYAAPQPSQDFAAGLQDDLLERQRELLAGEATKTIQTKPRPYSSIKNRRLRALWLALLGLLALSGLAYTLLRLGGFIPGFGFTSGSQVYVLQERIEASGAGLQVSLEQAFADTEKLQINLTVRDLPQEICFLEAQILPAGSQELLPAEWGSNTLEKDGKTSLIYIFAPLPARTYSAEFHLTTPDGQTLKIPFNLRPPEPSEVVPFPAVVNNPQQSPVRQGVYLQLEYVAVNSNETILQVSLNTTGPFIQSSGIWGVSLKDEEGRVYPLTEITTENLSSGGNRRIYKTLPFTGNEKLVLSLETFPASSGLPLYLELDENASGFTLDLGREPMPGQKWEINKELGSEDLQVQVLSVELQEGPRLVFEVKPGPGVSGLFLSSSDPLVTGMQGSAPVQEGTLHTTLELSKIPESPLKINLRWIYYSVKDEWQIYWQPPAALPAPETTPSPSPSPVAEVQTAQTQTPEDPILAEIQRYSVQFNTLLQQGPAWVFTQSETITNLQAGQTYPPPYLKSESWIEIDAQGTIQRALYRDYNEAGQVIQEALSIGNYSLNLSSGESLVSERGPYQLNLDLLPDLSAAVDYGSTITREEGVCEDGSPCLIITEWETFAKPFQNPGETQIFYGSGLRAWINTQSGQQVQYQNFWLLEDGSERVHSTLQYVLVEKFESAPQEVLDVLEEVIVP